jgi:hypothetical protein
MIEDRLANAHGGMPGKFLTRMGKCLKAQAEGR